MPYTQIDLDEDDQYDVCPVCGQEYTIQCKCNRSDRQCANGHHWHRCPVHGFWVGGEGDHSSEACSCMSRHPWIPLEATAWDETGWFTCKPIIAYPGTIPIDGPRVSLDGWGDSKISWVVLLAVIAIIYWWVKRNG